MTSSECIAITSREQWLALRAQDVTASVIGCLFGVHPHMTPAGLWAEKTGNPLPRKDNKQMRRGRMLEGAVAEAVREQQPTWEISKARDYWRDPAARIGATPDFYVVDNRPRITSRPGVMQAKTVNPWEFERSWQDGPPFWILLQLLTEMMIMGAGWGVVAVLIVDGFNFDCHLYEVPRHAGSERRIYEAVAAFWADVEAGREPQVDYERDGDLIAWLNRAAVPGEIIDLRGDNAIGELLDRHQSLTEWIKAAEAELKTVGNEIKHKIGTAEIATVPGWRVTYKQQTHSAYSVPEKSFRVLRVKPLPATAR